MKNNFLLEPQRDLQFVHNITVISDQSCNFSGFRHEIFGNDLLYLYSVPAVKLLICLLDMFWLLSFGLALC